MWQILEDSAESDGYVVSWSEDKEDHNKNKVKQIQKEMFIQMVVGLHPWWFEMEPIPEIQVILEDCPLILSEVSRNITSVFFRLTFLLDDSIRN